jgi:hypothetical protein
MQFRQPCYINYHLKQVQFRVNVKTEKKSKKLWAPLVFGGHIVHQWYNIIYKNQMFCSFNIYTRDILSWAMLLHSRLLAVFVLIFRQQLTPIA